MTKGDRPEHTAPPEIFYNEEEARKYTTNSRMIAIQVSVVIPLLMERKKLHLRHIISIKEAKSYCGGCHWIQAQLTERALELLALPDDGRAKLLLDLGCGSGLSGAALTDQGHTWVVRPLAPGLSAPSALLCRSVPHHSNHAAQVCG